MIDGHAHLFYKLSPGDVVALGIGNLKEKPRIGGWVNGLPLQIIDIQYIKDGRRYHKKWWQFWVKKKRWLIICRFIGDSMHENGKSRKCFNHKRINING